MIGAQLTTTYRVCAPSVVSEILDDEVIIMDLRTGNYFSAQGAACAVWEQIGQGTSEEAIVEALEASYNAPPAQLSEALKTYIAALLEHRLIEAQSRDAVAVQRPISPAGERHPFGGFMLYVHTDMQDLLLLDPIHDVEENLGWPARRGTAA